MAAFPFDVVAFDLDGTLADTAADFATALNRAGGARPDGDPPDLVRGRRALYVEKRGARCDRAA